jgi:hypothetical protein
MRSAKHGLVTVLVLLGATISSSRARADDKKEGTQLLVAFGASVGALLFQTHDNIGTCELAAAKDGSNAKEIETKLSITASILKVLIDNLAKAGEDKILSDADRTFVVKSTEAARLVQEEANALKAYIGGKDAKDHARYVEVRKKADREIRLILGIKG